MASRSPTSEREEPRRPTTTRRMPVWWILSVVALAAGYADLARGGTTLAPILLVIGYCVLIPIAILR